MIYITGDTHSDFTRFSTDKFPIQKEMTKNDYVIICGDFGGVWNYLVEGTYEKYWLDWLNEKNFTTLFVDGNHENFTRLYNYPIEEWHGGKVHKIRDSILHLMRGEIFDIDNKKFFIFGGAKSHDIQEGILNLDEEEKIYQYRKRGAYFRIRDYSWWDLELPTQDEMKNGINNLEKINYKVDYIITHCCPTSVQAILSGGTYKKDYLTDYLQEISEKCEFKKWYFGHYHDNKQIDSKYILLYEDIVTLEFKSVFKIKNIALEIRMSLISDIFYAEI